MSHTFYRNLRQPLPVVVRGEGIHLYDSNGKAYIDASGGAAVSCLGHGHPRVTAALKRQADALAFTQSSFFTTPVAEELADFLADRAPAGLDWVYFLSGGSEAVEAAMKLARYYWVERGQPQRKHFIARHGSYHGNTLGALALSGNLMRREPYLPILLPTQHVSACNAYRGQLDGEREEQYAQRLADELEAKILELGPDTVIAFFAETVVGATLGCAPPVKGYLQKVRAVCDKYDVLLVLDEIMSGMGRTGHMFAFSEDGVVPDITVMAKGLGAGYQPIGAMMIHDHIYKTLLAGSAFFMHGHTYTAHPIACAVALEVQKVIVEENLMANVHARGNHLRRRLHEVFGEHPQVGDIRGRGLFIGLELVADRDTKTPLPGDRQTWLRVKTKAMENGLLVYPMGGTADGKLGDHVIIAPPFNCTDREIDAIVARLETSIDAALK